MTLSKEQVLKISHLARLKLTDAETEFYQARLARVIDYVKELEKLEATASGERGMSDERESFRADCVSSFQSLEDLIKNAPDRDGSFFSIPPFLATRDYQ